MTFNSTNGEAPVGNLILDSNGDLFGTTECGGNRDVGWLTRTLRHGFDIVHGTTSLTTLVNFYGGNGNRPLAGLTFDANGNLFGTTYTGGTSNHDGSKSPPALPSSRPSSTSTAPTGGLPQPA